MNGKPEIDRRAAVLMAAHMGMEHFCALLIAQGRSGGSFDDETIAELAGRAVVAMKNVEAHGTPIETEVEILTNAVKLVEFYINGAIHIARNPP